MVLFTLEELLFILKTFSSAGDAVQIEETIFQQDGLSQIRLMQLWILLMIILAIVLSVATS
jgi:hypothetical protein